MQENNVTSCNASTVQCWLLSFKFFRGHLLWTYVTMITFYWYWYRYKKLIICLGMNAFFGADYLEISLWKILNTCWFVADESHCGSRWQWCFWSTKEWTQWRGGTQHMERTQSKLGLHRFNHWPQLGLLCAFRVETPDRTNKGCRIKALLT